jgi:hypothetical protein
MLWAALAAASCGDPDSTRPGNDPTTVSTPSRPSSPIASREEFQAFIPPTLTEGDRVVLPVVFPDGTTAELVYPPQLDLAGLGVRPYWAGCGRDFGFHYYDPKGTLYRGEPLQTWTRSDGQTVGVYEAVDREVGVDHEPLVYLIFHFDEWTVDVYDYGGNAAMSHEERKACALGLAASQTEDGWIVLSGRPEIHLGGDEPTLEFGGHSDHEPFVLFFPGPCEPTPDARRDIDGVMVELSEDFAAWCHPGAGMRIHVYFTGESTFVKQLVKNLEVRDVRLAA